MAAEKARGIYNDWQGWGPKGLQIDFAPSVSDQLGAGGIKRGREGKAAFHHLSLGIRKLSWLQGDTISETLSRRNPRSTKLRHLVKRASSKKLCSDSYTPSDSR
jgi:hypothetical protein